MESKTLKKIYWSALTLLTIGMLLSAIPSILKLPYAVEHFCNVLKLPEYLLPFTGILKILGLAVLFLPNLIKLKEWVFAGFTFNLIGAWYCNFMALHSFVAAFPVLIYMIILFVLYYSFTKLNTSVSQATEIHS